MSTMIDENLRVHVVDLETTGLDPEKDKVIEFAEVIVGFDGIEDQRSQLYSPGIPINPAASAAHHLVDEDVIDCQPSPPRDGYWSVPAVYACHNAAFDTSFIMFPGPVVCTMRLAQKLWPDLERYDNQFLRYFHELDVPVPKGSSMHRALPDATVTACLLLHELKEVLSRSDVPMTIEQLIDWIETPMLLHRVRFGKHGPKDGKPGLLWSEVPKDYLRWILKSFTDADRDTVYTAKHYLGQR
jgi:exodeoxyribonuclease X